MSKNAAEAYEILQILYELSICLSLAQKKTLKNGREEARDDEWYWILRGVRISEMVGKIRHFRIKGYRNARITHEDQICAERVPIVLSIQLSK